MTAARRPTETRGEKPLWEASMVCGCSMDGHLSR
jgi:hypothetical protein